MFLHLFVSDSVHEVSFAGQGCMHGMGVCVVGGMHGGGHA